MNFIKLNLRSAHKYAGVNFETIKGRVNVKLHSWPGPVY